MRAQKTYSEQPLDCVVDFFSFVVIALHHCANPVSCTHPGEEEALFLSSAEPQRGLLLLLSCFLHFGKQQEKEAHIFFWVEHFMVGFFSDANALSLTEITEL